MRNISILSAPLFVLSLVILLLNDFIFKYQFANLLTGKLSDFAGLFAFCIFFFAFLKQKHWRFTGIVIAVLFVLWKTPLSNGFIEWWNGISVLTISRVIDYSDLFAIIMIPLAFRFASRFQPSQRFSIHPTLPAMIALFAFTATSYSSDVHFNKSYSFPFSIDTLKQRLAKNDSMICNDYKLSSKNRIDTLSISIYSGDFHPGFNADVIINGDTAESTIKLYYAYYPDKKIDNDSLLILKDFEKCVINRIK
ncbi:MAG: hypothetical protein V2A54_11695 [Bacteroidota bacterium]